METFALPHSVGTSHLLNAHHDQSASKHTTTAFLSVHTYNQDKQLYNGSMEQIVHYYTVKQQQFSFCSLSVSITAIHIAGTTSEKGVVQGVEGGGRTDEQTCLCRVLAAFRAAFLMMHERVTR